MVAKIKANGKKIRLRKLNNGTFQDWNSKQVFTQEELIFPSTDKKEFLKELKDLLEKYNACISWTCGEGSDTYGIYDDHICACLNDEVEIDFEDACIDCDNCDSRK